MFCFECVINEPGVVGKILSEPGWRDEMRLREPQLSLPATTVQSGGHKPTERSARTALNPNPGR